MISNTDKSFLRGIAWGLPVLIAGALFSVIAPHQTWVLGFTVIAAILFAQFQVRKVESQKVLVLKNASRLDPIVIYQDGVIIASIAHNNTEYAIDYKGWHIAAVAAYARADKEHEKMLAAQSSIVILDIQSFEKNNAQQISPATISNMPAWRLGLA